MHFLEIARFLNAPHFGGHKVKGYFTPRCWSLRPAVGVWALKPLFSHLHKNTNEPVSLYGAWPLWFWYGANTLGTWAIANSPNGPRNVFAPHQNHNGPYHIINRFINSYCTCLEVDLILLSILALVEESVDDPVAQGVDGQLGDPQEVLPGQVALPRLVQAWEPTPKQGIALSCLTRSLCRDRFDGIAYPRYQRL